MYWKAQYIKMDLNSYTEYFIWYINMAQKNKRKQIIKNGGQKRHMEADDPHNNIWCFFTLISRNIKKIIGVICLKTHVHIAIYFVPSTYCINLR